jgi:hypothetical protein
MPIRINLLAEAQAAEEARRRDPVKRAIWVCGFLVFLGLFWSSKLQFEIILANSNSQRYNSQWLQIEKNYQEATADFSRSFLVEKKLAALQHYSTNRFLWAPVLNALQFTLADKVQVMRIKTEQTYIVQEPVPPRKGADGKTVPGKPGSSTERVVLIIDARNFGNERDLTLYKNQIAEYPFFKRRIEGASSIRLASLAPLTADPETSRLYTGFIFECVFPSQTRDE